MPLYKPKKHRKTAAKRPLRELSLFLLDILYNAVIIITLVVLIRSFLISPFRVIGSSMADTLHSNEFILIDKLSYHLGEPRRGDPIVFLPPITNKYAHKFEEAVSTDANGIAELKIDELESQKRVFYCRNNLVKKFWFCKDRVNENDLVYYRPINGDPNDAIDITWKNADKKTISRDDVKSGATQIAGKPNQSYLLRIYDSTGPDYFVKRVIGIPGDTIYLENGRVYLKMTDSDEFVELDETYLNEENQFNTYFKKTPEMSEFLVPEGQYFVMGDNRSHSNDSRHWFSPIDENPTPFVSQEEISGRVLIVLWPPNDLRLIPSSVLD